MEKYGKNMERSRTHNQALGKWGEELAVDYMVKHGFEIVATNYRIRYGEVDIIATQGEIIVFCEVKTRKTLKYGTPGSAVNHEKRKHIMRVAEYFLSAGDWELFSPRFDVIEVFSFDETTINHMTDAYQLED